MKVLLTIARIFVGVLFIFSGLVKANDPLGLSYKMQEFFEVWNMHFLNDYSLVLAYVMNVFEIVAGVAVLLGWRMKLFGWLLLLLIIFFTFLTAYAAFSGKITACGCFGDCIPLKPMQSFWKDVILLVLILFLLLNHRKIQPLMAPKAALVVLILSTLAVVALQWYVLKHLPIVDCLPYKKGNNLLEQMKMPPGATADEYAYTFRYRKNGKEVTYAEDQLPEDLDDTYEFIDREQKLVKKGNGLLPKITDFNLVTPSGNDTTQAILQQTGKYVMVLTNTFDAADTKRYDVALWKNINSKIPVYIVTSQPVVMNDLLVLKCDGTVIKTAARANPTYFVMEGATVLGKYSYADAHKMQALLK